MDRFQYAIIFKLENGLDESWTTKVHEWIKARWFVKKSGFFDPFPSGTKCPAPTLSCSHMRFGSRPWWVWFSFGPKCDIFLDPIAIWSGTQIRFSLRHKSNWVPDPKFHCWLNEPAVQGMQFTLVTKYRHIQFQAIWVGSHLFIVYSVVSQAVRQSSRE